MSLQSIKWVRKVMNEFMMTEHPISAVLNIVITPRKTGDVKAVDEMGEALKKALKNMEVMIHGSNKITLQWFSNPDTTAKDLFVSRNGYSQIVKAIAMQAFMTEFNNSEFAKQRGTVTFLTSAPFDYLSQFTYKKEE